MIYRFNHFLAMILRFPTLQPLHQSLQLELEKGVAHSVSGVLETSERPMNRFTSWCFRNPKANHRLDGAKTPVNNGMSTTTTVPSTGSSGDPIIKVDTRKINSRSGKMNLVSTSMACSKINELQLHTFLTPCRRVYARLGSWPCCLLLVVCLQHTSKYIE